jgi:cytidylate kinase
MKIAVDGPAGSGKSTVSKIIAKNFKLLYLDTGAMYRAVTYALLKNNIDLNNEKLICDFIKKIDFKINKNENSDELDIFVNNEKVNRYLRLREVDNNVSLVSSYKCIRDWLVEIQRRIAKENDVILDGRDIGTVVLPDADFKFYLDASIEERARRRFYDEKNEKQIPIEEIKKDLIKRDKLDSNRKLAPLKKAEDAIYIDTTNKSIDEVIRIISEIINKKLNK